MLACYSNALLPDGQILGHWTQKCPSKIICGLGNQWPRKWPSSKFPNCGIILTKIGPIICIHKFLIHFFRWFGGEAGLRPNFFGWTGPGVLAGSGSKAQMTGFDSKVGTQLKITENGQSISLQPGFTSKMVKAKSA
jgi:hypothetical protein